MSAAGTELPPLMIELAVGRAVAAYEGEPGALLPVLHQVQAELKWLPPAALTSVAAALNLSRADVHGVVSFYHDFRTKPPGALVVKVCRAEACQARGSDALVAYAEKRLCTAMHSTRADGGVTLEPVYCLGNCALGPSVLVDGELAGRVTPARFDALVIGVEGAP